MAKDKWLSGDPPPQKSDEPQKKQLSEAEAARIAATSPDAEPAPKPAPLIPPAKGPEGKPLEDHPPTPPTAAPDPAPRLVDQNERAPEGLKRFKLRVVNFGTQPVRYVLAKDEEAAKEHYLKTTGIKAILDTLGEDAEKPLFSVRPQPD